MAFFLRLVPETPGHSLTLNALETLIDTNNIGRFPVEVADDRSLIAGRYRIVRPLGEGGMGNVYLADDLLLARQVAVKTIRPELSGNQEVRTRIKRECRMHAAIGVHPQVITLYDTVEENGRIYLVMEYFAGTTLAGRLAATPAGPGLPLDQALDVIRQLLRALACIHDRDIVHRDIKTSNILLQLRDDGRYLAKLTDFGIARAETEPGDLTRLTSLGTQGPGTPVYMAPERIDPQTFGDICPATDLYAVGIILFELLTGGPPFRGSMTEIFSGHLVQPPALNTLPTDIPAGLETVLRKALAKKPADRYQDAAAFLEALAAIGEGEGPLPCHAAAIEEATLLATDSGRTGAVGCNATLLDPAIGRGTALPANKRKWLYLVAAVVVVLAGYLLQSHFTGLPVTQPLAAATATKPPAAPVTGHSPDDQAAEKNLSALQAVEKARQQKNTESMAAANRNDTGTAGVQEWQVVESNSRKIR